MTFTCLVVGATIHPLSLFLVPFCDAYSTHATGITLKSEIDIDAAPYRHMVCPDCRAIIERDVAEYRQGFSVGGKSLYHDGAENNDRRDDER